MTLYTPEMSQLSVTSPVHCDDAYALYVRRNVPLTAATSLAGPSNVSDSTVLTVPLRAQTPEYAPQRPLKEEGAQDSGMSKGTGAIGVPSHEWGLRVVSET